MLCADSKHIVKLHSVHETKSETALLLELATGGELQAMLDDEGALSEAQVRICMQEILKALQHLHKKYIAHLDLKPQNILLCGDKVEGKCVPRIWGGYLEDEKERGWDYFICCFFTPKCVYKSIFICLFLDGLKLCDFGISRHVEDGGKIREILGTPDYVAPEVSTKLCMLFSCLEAFACSFRGKLYKYCV